MRYLSKQNNVLKFKTNLVLRTLVITYTAFLSKGKLLFENMTVSLPFTSFSVKVTRYIIQYKSGLFDYIINYKEIP